MSQDLDQQLHNIVNKKVTKGKHKHNTPKNRQDRTLKKCIELFKEGANPEVLTELEESLGEQKYRDYYTQHFLPALLREVILSVELNTEKVAQIISGIIDKSRDKSRFLEELVQKVEQSKKLDSTQRKEKKAIMMELITLNFLNEIKNGQGSGNKASGRSWRRSRSLSNLLEQNDTNIFEPNSGNGSDSGMESRELSDSSSTSQLQARNGGISRFIKKSQLKRFRSQSDLSEQNDTNIFESNSGNGSDSGVVSRKSSETRTSSQESLNSTLSSAEEDSDLQKEETANQMQPEQTVEQAKGNGNSDGQVNQDQGKNTVGPDVIPVANAKVQRKESTDPSGQAIQMKGSHTKDLVKSEEKKNKENAAVQRPSANRNDNKDIPLKKQPDGRNLHVALAAGCILSTIGCIVAGAVTLGIGRICHGCSVCYSSSGRIAFKFPVK